jgi:hypothetical protein
MEGPTSKKTKESYSKRESQGEHQILKPPPLARSISKKERGGPLERILSLIEPSPACNSKSQNRDRLHTRTNTTDTLCL